MTEGGQPNQYRITRHHFILPFVGRVCKSFFGWYWQLGEYQLRSLISNLKKTSLLSPPVYKQSKK